MLDKNKSSQAAERTQTDQPKPAPRSWIQSLKWANLPLPAKLLVLTSVFVMLAEILIFLPSVANYRLTWLNERVTDATLASLAADASSDGQVPLALRKELLQTARVRAVAWRRNGRRELVLPPERPMFVDSSIDLRAISSAQTTELILARASSITDAIYTLFSSSNRTFRVIGKLGDEPSDFIEVVLPEAPLRDAMHAYMLNILGLSIIISLFTAALVYIALSALLVRPMLRITRNMLYFGDNPEDTSRIITPSNRSDEIGTAERELEAMQRQLTGLLKQKNRLAQLGLAVSKINHDLRNMLANAQLISDRLADVPDPTVQRFAPKLIASLDRAISFCSNTLQFGRAEEDAPRRELALLLPVANDVGDALGLTTPDTDISWHVDIPHTLQIDADPAHLHRVLTNLCRNAIHALRTSPPEAGGIIKIKSWRDGRRVKIEIHDNGPGIPENVKGNLFRAFQTSQTNGGTGLGLTIAYELTAAHGGMLELIDSATGAAFRLDIPDRCVS